jgi:hypothetical protein
VRPSAYELAQIEAAARAYQSKATAELISKSVSYLWGKMKSLLSWLFSSPEPDYYKIERMPGYGYKRIIPKDY